MTRVGESGPAKGCVLLVDDDASVLEVQAEMVRRLGHCVAARQDPLEAFDLFKRNPYGFDLVITDEIMPGMRGTEVAARIRDIRPDVPVIIITAGFDIEKTRERADGLFAAGVFLKPLDKKGMAAALKLLLRRSRGGETTS